MLFASAASGILRRISTAWPEAACCFLRALACFFDLGERPRVLSDELSPLSDSSCTIDLKVKIRSHSLPIALSQELSVTYIEAHPQVIHSRDEGILGKVLHLAVEDLFLERVLVLQFEFGRADDVSTRRRHGRALLPDGFLGVFRASCPFSCHFALIQNL